MDYLKVAKLFADIKAYLKELQEEYDVIIQNAENARSLYHKQFKKRIEQQRRAEYLQKQLDSLTKTDSQS